MQEARYTVTLKGGDINDPWLIIKADAMWELKDALDMVIEGDICARIKWAQRTMKAEVSNV